MHRYIYMWVPLYIEQYKIEHQQQQPVIKVNIKFELSYRKKFLLDVIHPDKVYVFEYSHQVK